MEELYPEDALFGSVWVMLNLMTLNQSRLQALDD